MNDKVNYVICPKCGSSDINFQITTETIKSSIGVGSCLGVIFLLMIPIVGWIILLLSSPNYKAKNSTIALCNNCGHTWKHKENKDKVKLAVVIIFVILSIIISFAVIMSSLGNATIRH